MKKLFSVILTICIIIAVVPMGSFSITASAETATSGTTGDCTWSLDGTVLTISGNGKMGDYYSLIPWGTDITKVIIEDGVTSIGNSAFSGCSSLTNITIPDSVTSIGSGAFYNTGYYNNAANWQDDVLYIGNHLIDCKTSKTGECEIKAGTKTVANKAFYYCDRLKSATIPDSVTSIGVSAFEDCSNLTSITIPKSVTSISNGAFSDCYSLKNVYITDIGSWCNITFEGDYYSHSNPLEYADNLYLNGELVKDIVIPDGITKIYPYAFSCTSLESITIPNSVTSISNSAFYSCKSLISITIPDSVTSIGGSAFSNCESLTSITMPESIISIGDYAFSGCYRLKSIKIPNSVTIIGRYAFSWCSSLTSITIPNRVTKIFDYAFSNCKSLTSITITDSIASIGLLAFGGCLNLKDVWYTGSEEEKSEIYIEIYNEVLTSATWHYNTCSGGVEHTYDNKNDAFCNVCGHIRKIKNFDDVAQDDWYSKAVNYAVGSGIMTGYATNGLFGTSDSIQRQDFIVMLARYDGVDLSAYTDKENKFTDVDNTGYYAAAVKWGADKGIITGYTEGDKAGCFGVGDTITREQLVTMLYRYAKNVLGKDVTVSGNAAANATEKFNDYSKVSVFSKDAVLWATEKTVINGKGEKHDAIDPQGNAQRCEVAQIMYNIFKNNIL